MTDADVVTRLVHAIDARDWDTVRVVCADEVRMDYTSLWGGEPFTASIDELLVGWRALIDGFPATQHLLGPFVTVDGRLHTHVRASHWLDGEVWTVYGHYIALVADGRITEYTLQAYQQAGNLDLPDRARARTAAAAGRS
jgi:SnoaL-like protein